MMGLLFFLYDTALPLFHLRLRWPTLGFGIFAKPRDDP